MYLTPAQAHRLSETYDLDTPRGDFIEYRPCPAGELVVWLSLDELDALVYGACNPSRRSAGRVTQRASTLWWTAPPWTRPAREGDLGCFGGVVAGAGTAVRSVY